MAAGGIYRHHSTSQMSKSNGYCCEKRPRAQREPCPGLLHDAESRLGFQSPEDVPFWADSHIRQQDSSFPFKSKDPFWASGLSPQMSEQRLGAAKLALENRNRLLSGTTVALGPASHYCFLGIAMGCVPTLALVAFSGFDLIALIYFLSSLNLSSCSKFHSAFSPCHPSLHAAPKYWEKEALSFC